MQKLWQSGRQLALARVQRLREGRRPGELVHIPTGLASFDDKFGGLEVGCVTLLLAHTGEGKSSVVRQFLLGAADRGVRVLDISLEDPEDKTMDRILSNRANVPSFALNRLEPSKQQMRAIDSVVDMIPEWDCVNENPGLDGLVPLIVSWLKENPAGPRLIGIDYIQRIADTEESLGRLGNDLADLAKKYNIAILVASQVKSDAIAEARKRMNFSKPPAVCPPTWRDFTRYFQPQMSDAKLCRRLEESAKCVLCFFRPGRWGKSMYGWDVPDNSGELHVLKANFGALGHFSFSWDGVTQRIF